MLFLYQADRHAVLHAAHHKNGVCGTQVNKMNADIMEFVSDSIMDIMPKQFFEGMDALAKLPVVTPPKVRPFWCTLLLFASLSASLSAAADGAALL